MKRIKAIRHRIDQKTADRKNARRRKRFLFRLQTKPLVQPVETIDEAQAKAKEQLFGKSPKKGNTYDPKRQKNR